MLGWWGSLNPVHCNVRVGRYLEQKVDAEEAVLQQGGGGGTIRLARGQRLGKQATQLGVLLARRGDLTDQSGGVVFDDDARH